MKTRLLALCAAVIGATALAADNAAARNWRHGQYAAPYHFWLFHPKVQVGPYLYQADWNCVASDGYTAYVSQDSSKTRAQNRLRDIGATNIVCNLTR